MECVCLTLTQKIDTLAAAALVKFTISKHISERHKVPSYKLLCCAVFDSFKQKLSIWHRL